MTFQKVLVWCYKYQHFLKIVGQTLQSLTLSKDCRRPIWNWGSIKVFVHVGCFGPYMDVMYKWTALRVHHFLSSRAVSFMLRSKQIYRTVGAFHSTEQIEGTPTGVDRGPIPFSSGRDSNGCNDRRRHEIKLAIIHDSCLAFTSPGTCHAKICGTRSHRLHLHCQTWTQSITRIRTSSTDALF
jgi:hypothetical protein